MKLSKFVKRAKSESYCVVIHADDSGIWLGTRLALYNATELPYMEGKEQAGAVLDIDSKAWEKMFFDEKCPKHKKSEEQRRQVGNCALLYRARKIPVRPRGEVCLFGAALYAADRRRGAGYPLAHGRV